MHLVLVGLNHRTAPLDLLERFCLAPEAQRALLAPGMAVDGGRPFYEAALLATCNRAEAYVVVGEAANARGLVVERLAAAGGVPAADLDPVLYTAVDEGAVRHLFEVAAGLDSMVVGEWQILSQVQDAY
ncbi:MAG: glutamyl-tRNA reductase, partial [Gemmatimonadetes bacterium]|nr:glutamyl-tRNA reductase [Gemmatimonadota bacterium]